jgi:predicted dehydrogenase
MASHNPLRLGVIGAGWFASRRHCPDIVDHDDAVLTAFCRRSPTELAKMGTAFGVESLFTDYRDLLACGQVDGVVICSPHNLHYEHTRAALEAGLPVLLEKPLTVDPSHGRELLQLATARDLVLLVAQNPPYWSHCHHLRNAIGSSQIGTLESISISWVGNALGVLGREPLPDDLPGVVPPTLFRSDRDTPGDGFLADGGSHLLTELVWCTGHRVVEVVCLMDDAAGDMRAALSMRLDNGAMVNLSNTADSQVRSKRQHSLYVGSTGVAELRGVPFQLSISNAVGHQSWAESDLPAVASPVQDFVGAIRGTNQLQMDGETALHVVEILDAAYRSAQGGGTVMLSTGQQGAR